jgi:hypothetical protein
MNSTLLGIMLEPFCRAHAGVDIMLREMNMTELYRILDAGRLDYIFGATTLTRRTGGQRPSTRNHCCSSLQVRHLRITEA